MAFEPLRFKNIDHTDLLTEEEVLSKSYKPFLGPGERPEPYRTYYLSYEQLRPIFERERVTSQLLVDIPGKGRALLVRIWRSQLDVLLLSGNVLDERTTTLRSSEYAFFTDEGVVVGKQSITLVLDTLVLNPPKLS